MRILLIPPKNNYPDPTPSRDIIGQAFPYLAAVLKKEGHEVSAVNMNYQWCQPSAPVILERLINKTIAEFQPDAIALGGLSADYLFIRDAIRLIRKTTVHTPIICGGGIISSDVGYIFPLLSPDFAVVGEGEEAIVELTNCMVHGGKINTIDGIAYWKNGEPVYNSPRKPIADLDKLPFPDYNLFDFEKYMSIINQKDNHFHCRTRHHPRLMPLITARSCPFNCTFCYHTTGRTYRTRSIDNAIEEINYFHEMHHFNILKLYDELFSIDENRVKYFCQRLKELPYEFDWSCSMRVSDVNINMLREMKNAGCIHIAYGFESASPTVLESMRKKITVEQIRRAIELTNEAGIGVQANFIFGDIAEMPETIQETMDFYHRYCKNLIIHCDYITPYPGSAIFRFCLENGIISDKQAYYEAIHYRPRINMTQMNYRDFQTFIEPIVGNKYFGFQSARILSCEKQTGTNFDLGSPPSFRRSSYKIRGICPHCDQNIDYLFPLKLDLEPVISFCSKCHKRFVFPTLEFSEIKNNYKRYIEDTRLLAISQKAVVVVPLIDKNEMAIHKFYGLNYDQLNIVCFMDWNSWAEGASFLSWPVICLNSTNIHKYRDYDFLILPCSSSQEIINELNQHGVCPEKLHYCETLATHSHRKTTITGHLLHKLKIVIKSRGRFLFKKEIIKYGYNYLYKISRMVFPRPL
ncbi:B12-binding domain-containing radical SAM protein [Thermodesulfobacteriota bacterium]